jgi:hypothetical protein
MIVWVCGWGMFCRRFKYKERILLGWKEMRKDVGINGDLTEVG